MRLHSILAALLLVSFHSAQTAGYMDLSFANTTGAGSATIPARVYYPASASGAGAPLIPTPGGYPVVVFQHGQGRLGTEYTRAGDHLGSRGYVAVFPEAPQQQVADGIALFSLLQTAHGTPGHPLEGALDMGRAGIAGHSVGGGNTLRVLASNPGYLAGFCLAPFNPGAAIVGQVTVPLGVVHGRGDNVLAWAPHGRRIYNNAIAYTKLRCLYVMGDACDHDNVAGLSGNPVGLAVWQRVASATAGYFDAYLKSDASGLGEFLGTSARSDPNYDHLYAEVKEPELWTVGPPALGSTVLVELIGEPGPAAVMTGASTTAIPTAFGLLRLDPSTLNTPLRGMPDPNRLVTWTVQVPTSFVPGSLFPIQGFGLSSSGGLRLTDLWTLTIE